MVILERGLERRAKRRWPKGRFKED